MLATHNQQDQRLSVVFTALGAAKTLEHPENYLAVIRKNVAPVKGRELKVQVMTVAFNFKAWFHQTGVSISGLTPNPRAGQIEVIHCWRLVARKDLPNHDMHLEQDWIPRELKPQDYRAHDMDVIMLVKEWTCSDNLSQPPSGIMPYEYLSKLELPLAVLPRNDLGHRACNEFLKTAKVVEQEPWDLHVAASYLREWVGNNQSQCFTTPDLPEF